MFSKRTVLSFVRILRIGLFASLIAGLTLGFLAPITARAQSVEDSFNPDANGAVNVIVTQPDGKIIIGGEFTQVGGQTRNYIARLNFDGTLDTDF